MSLLDLPNEILCMIAERIPSQTGVKAFMMSHRRVYILPQLRECLYNRTKDLGKHRLNHVLLWACENNNQDLARAMLRLGADIKCTNRSQVFTPLTFAATEGNAEIVKLLLEHEPSIINRAAGCGYTALKGAVWKGHIEIVKILLAQSDLDPSAAGEHPDPLLRPPHYRRKPLNDALSRGNEEVVGILMEDRRFELDIYSLVAAADGGNENLVKMCLQKAPPKDQYFDESALSVAASRGHTAIVKLLLKDGGLGPNEINKYGRTPLHSAASGGHDDIVKMLLDRDDVEPDAKDMSNTTPLSDAARYGRVGVIELLLGTGKVDPDTEDQYAPYAVIPCCRAWRARGRESLACDRQSGPGFH